MATEKNLNRDSWFFCENNDQRKTNRTKTWGCTTTWIHSSSSPIRTLKYPSWVTLWKGVVN